jgi:CheY-like chemotaxis protein
MDFRQSQTHRLQDVKVLLSDGQSASRGSLRDALLGFGFRQIEMVERASGVAGFLDRAGADLVVCDTDQPEGDICDVIHGLRHGQVGDDPFVPVMAVTWAPTPPTVEKIVRSGADLLLALPVSADRISGGVQRLIERRKPFVATSDYIGPDRRGPGWRGSASGAAIEVPNPLRARVTGISDDHLYESRFQRINERKVEHHAARITALVELVVGHFTGGKQDRNIAGHLERLRFLSNDMHERVHNTKHAHQAQLCGSVLLVASRIAEEEEPPAPKDLDLLTQVSLAFQVAFASDEHSADAAMDIARAVGG